MSSPQCAVDLGGVIRCVGAALIVAHSIHAWFLRLKFEIVMVQPNDEIVPEASSGAKVESIFALK